MRIISIKTAQEAEYGSRHVTVEWLDGSTTMEAVPGTVPRNRYGGWLERKRSAKLRCWRRC
jgi:hypothetical protein